MAGGGERQLEELKGLGLQLKKNDSEALRETIFTILRRQDKLSESSSKADTRRKQETDKSLARTPSQTVELEGHSRGTYATPEWLPKLLEDLEKATTRSDQVPKNERN